MSIQVCQYCDKPLNRHERDRQQCSCGAMQMQGQSFAPVRGADSAENIGMPDRPWVPQQLFGASVLFGPLACGVIAGVNYARLGLRQYLVPCILLGAVLFVLESAFVIFQAPASAAQFIAVLGNLLVGGLFQVIHKPAFEEWKQANWQPTVAGEVYKPNRGGLFLVLCLVSLAVEVLVVGVLLGVQASL